MDEEAQPLNGRIALVTGASRGIGRSVAIRLARAGADVGIVARTERALQETKRDVEAAGRRCVAAPGDVSSPADVTEAVNEVQGALGPVDVLINNAGRVIPTTTALADADPDDWWNVIEVNLRGPMLVTRALLPQMIQRGSGRIFNIGSLVGARPLPGFSAYSISKAALVGLTDSLAAELAGSGCFAFDLSPGLVRTAMTEELDVFQDVPDEEWTPIERTGEVIIQLCSGRYDALAGRFIHASDDLDALLAMIQGGSDEGRRLRLLPAAPEDPLLN